MYKTDRSRCVCPDTWECPHCVYACESCSDQRESRNTLTDLEVFEIAVYDRSYTDYDDEDMDEEVSK